MCSALFRYIASALSCQMWNTCGRVRPWPHPCLSASKQRRALRYPDAPCTKLAVKLKIKAPSNAPLCAGTTQTGSKQLREVTSMPKFARFVNVYYILGVQFRRHFVEEKSKFLMKIKYKTISNLLYQCCANSRVRRTCRASEIDAIMLC